MGAVRLGRISLRWCRACNVPLVELAQCGICNSETIPVELTPPGDYRPGFPFDISRVRKTIDSQFGEGIGLIMIPDGHLVVLNKCPAVDTMDEVIADGQVLGTHAFEPGKGWKFMCRLEGAHRIASNLTKGWVKIDEGAIPSMEKGASAMAVGVLDADPEIKAGDEVIVLAGEGLPVVAGRAKISGPDMLSVKRGPAVKTRWYKPVEYRPVPEGTRNWEDAVKANSEQLAKRISKAKEYVRKTTRRFEELPVAVSISGGKDSLVTLLLVLEAGLKPDLIFVDTGLEFPETVENVERTAKKFELVLYTEHAGDAFWHAVEHFGPSGKDFRWCCKTCKLGPTASLIRKHYPKGVLSFIGQRQYESYQRYDKGNIWRNPWVPGQVGASPIQTWPSMLVWLYIFSKGAEYNPLYEKGMERIGCWLCPASDLAELETVKLHTPDFEKWQSILKKFAKEQGFPDDWLALGLWRWKDLNQGLKDFLARTGRDDLARAIEKKRGFELEISKLGEKDIERILEFVCIIGGAEWDAEKKKFNVPDEKIMPVIMKALYCVGCGICISRCDSQAIKMVNRKVVVDGEKCVACGKCMHPCTVIDFLPR